MKPETQYIGSYGCSKIIRQKFTLNVSICNAGAFFALIKEKLSDGRVSFSLKGYTLTIEYPGDLSELHVKEIINAAKESEAEVVKAVKIRDLMNITEGK